MPAISIIVPAYNAEQTIRRCIQSILDQTYTDFEVLAVDDGSTDQTPQILDELAAADHRIIVLHKNNSGVSDSRNMALRLAAGTYVQFVDADDYLPSTACLMFVHAMEDHPGCDLVISDFYRVINGKMARKGDIDEEKLMTREEFAKHMMHAPADFYYGVLWNKFYRRSIIVDNDLSMDVNLSWAEDFIFNMEYILHANMIYSLRYATYYYVRTEGSLVESQGVSLAKTVQMKLAVIEYYSRFYKNIYTTGGYYLRSPQIYSFLLNFARDGGVAPIGTRLTVGQNPADVRFSAQENDNPFVTGFYNDLLLDHVLEHIGTAYSLEDKDVRVLLYLQLAGGTATLSEIRSYTGFSGRALSAALSRLSRRKLIRKTHKAPVHYTFGEEAGNIRIALENTPRNIREILMQDFTPEEQQTYRQLRSRAARNVRAALGEADLPGLPVRQGDGSSVS